MQGLNITEDQWVEPVVVDVQVPQLPPDLAPLLVHHQEDQSHHQQQQQGEQQPHEQQQHAPNDHNYKIVVENAPSDDHKVDTHAGSSDNEAGTIQYKTGHSHEENGSYVGAASGETGSYVGAASGDVGEAHGGIDAVHHNDPHGGEEGGPVVKPKKDYKVKKKLFFEYLSLKLVYYIRQLDIVVHKRLLCQIFWGDILKTYPKPF